VDHDLALLRLLQLADSALPIGSAAHSFGLESVIADGLLADRELEFFFGDYLQENGVLDAAFCRAAHRLAGISGEEFAGEWRSLNQRLSARKLPRESRDASLALGRRFLRLASDILPSPLAASETESHHVTAFGLVTALAGIGENSAVLAWLHQSITALVSAAQRLAPLGQTRASGMLWSLKPLLAEIAQASNPAEADCFAPIPEIASMRHARLTTRLFMS
jgi:urease accessory protein